MDTSGYWDKVLDGFVRYFTRYAGWLPGVIEGASPARIDEVEALVGQALPPEYRAFLLRLGETPGGVLDPFMEHIQFGVDAIEAMYRQPGFRPPPDAVFLWTYDYDTPYDIFLSTQGEERDTRGLFQAAWSVDHETGALQPEPPGLVPRGGSLMRTLCTEGFLKLRDPLLEHAVQLRDRAAAPETEEAQQQLQSEFAATAARLGFAAVPYVDGEQVFFDRADASLKLYGQPGANVVYVRASDEREMGRLGEVLADTLGLAIWR